MVGYSEVIRMARHSVFQLRVEPEKLAPRQVAESLLPKLVFMSVPRTYWPATARQAIKLSQPSIAAKTI
jgi:hypothetical protein